MTVSNQMSFCLRMAVFSIEYSIVFVIQTAGPYDNHSIYFLRKLKNSPVSWALAVIGIPLYLLYHDILNSHVAINTWIHQILDGSSNFCQCCFLPFGRCPSYVSVPGSSEELLFKQSWSSFVSPYLRDDFPSYLQGALLWKSHYTRSMHIGTKCNFYLFLLDSFLWWSNEMHRSSLPWCISQGRMENRYWGYGFFFVRWNLTCFVYKISLCFSTEYSFHNL